MAVTQTNADCAGMSPVSYKDSDGYWYTQIGSIRIYMGSGSPNTVIGSVAGATNPIPIGSLYIRRDSGTVTTLLYINLDGTYTWSYATVT